MMSLWRQEERKNSSPQPGMTTSIAFAIGALRYRTFLPATNWFGYRAPQLCSESTVSYSTGLYCFDHLKTPKGFQRLVDDAIERSEELISYISETPPSTEIIRTMDEISNTVCSVIDSAELCRHTHPDREFVVEATNASTRINQYLHYLNTNHTLYNAVVKAEKANLPTEEAQRAARFLRVDFENGGIHLSPEKLDRVSQLNIEISHLCRVFNENIALEPGYVDIFPASRIPKKLHHVAEPIYRRPSGSLRQFSCSHDDTYQRGFRILTESATLSSFLQWVSDEEVRKLVYIQGNSVPRANIHVLDKLIAARHEFAQVLGFKSYAEFALQRNMAAKPEVVLSFLLEMKEIINSMASEEFSAIKNFKREMLNSESAYPEPWDETFITGKLRSYVYNLDSSVIASYFPLSQCIEGLKLLVESLFGVTFRKVPLAPDETWHPDVFKLSLHHPEQGDLGYLYLDLYMREGKYPGCAHFAVKGGRRVSENEYQIPVVALVCNFMGAKPSDTRLFHWEVETLFHEFGHALHSLFSRTDYQHFSGTRVVSELAETPSNLFECYAWDYRFLKKFAKDYSSGETIPEDLVKSMQGARKMFAATDLQRQIFYALMDQTLFGIPLGRDTSSVVADLKRECTNWRHVEGTHWHTRFVHLLNYGAGYYSYLYARCFAATIWHRVCKEDPLSSETGTAIRDKFLQHGGAKDPADLLKDLGGDDILRYRDGGVVPDITCLCHELNEPVL